MTLDNFLKEFRRQRVFVQSNLPTAPEAIAAGPPSASLRAVKQRLPNRKSTASTVDSTAGRGQLAAGLTQE
jgi:hypothetical protein